MYFASCNTQVPNPRMYVSYTSGEGDSTTGGIFATQMSATSGGMVPTGDARHFPECTEMLGISASSDCSTIAALCRRPTRSSESGGFTKDMVAAITSDNKRDWLTQPDNSEFKTGDEIKYIDEIWMYEWTGGNLQAEPEKYVAHKAIGSWEYGSFYLLHGENDNSYALSMKAMVFDGSGGPHEADAFLIVDRSDYTITNRGWYWACGTGHTIFNHASYNPVTQKYAAFCETDYNSDQLGGQGGIYMRLEDESKQDFFRVDVNRNRQKGGPTSLLPLSDGGFIGVMAVPRVLANPDNFNLPPVTEIAVVRFNVDGTQNGSIKWVVSEPNTFLSYPQLAPFGDGTFLLGYGLMAKADSVDGATNDHFRIPREFYVLEIDDQGNPLTESKKLEGVGWGEQDQMVSLGPGKVGWAYIENPKLVDTDNLPACNPNVLQISTYTAGTDSL